MLRQAGEYLAIELRVRLPGLAGNDAAIANGLLVYKCSTSLLSFEADVFIAGNALTFSEACGGEYLDTMADGEDPFLLCVEFAGDLEQAPIVAEVLRSATAQNKDGIIISHIYVVEREVGLQAVAGTFDVGIPSRLKVVHDEVEAASRRGSNGYTPVFLLKPMNGIKSFVGFAGISSNDQYLWHNSAAILSLEDEAGRPCGTRISRQ